MIDKSSKNFLYCRRIAFIMRNVFEKNKYLTFALGIVAMIKYDVLGLWLAVGSWILATVIWDLFLRDNSKGGGEHDRDHDEYNQ